jgi:hypothetical protein
MKQYDFCVVNKSFLYLLLNHIILLIRANDMYDMVAEHEFSAGIGGASSPVSPATVHWNVCVCQHTQVAGSPKARQGPTIYHRGQFCHSESRGARQGKQGCIHVWVLRDSKQPVPASTEGSLLSVEKRPVEEQGTANTVCHDNPTCSFLWCAEKGFRPEE